MFFQITTSHQANCNSSVQAKLTSSSVKNLQFILFFPGIESSPATNREFCPVRFAKYQGNVDGFAQLIASGPKLTFCEDFPCRASVEKLAVAAFGTPRWIQSDNVARAQLRLVVALSCKSDKSRLGRDSRVSCLHETRRGRRFSCDLGDGENLHCCSTWELCGS